ncbi:MAG: hypothetical protein M1829_002521 [Trizodia sp. TS-e1964]|nr:MAG: hypothetical protein M1829_002521 [Trizodia sp. TS-e1964]
MAGHDLFYFRLLLAESGQQQQVKQKHVQGEEGRKGRMLMIPAEGEESHGCWEGRRNMVYALFGFHLFFRMDLLMNNDELREYTKKSLSRRPSSASPSLPRRLIYLARPTSFVHLSFHLLIADPPPPSALLQTKLTEASTIKQQHQGPAAKASSSTRMNSKLHA